MSGRGGGVARKEFEALMDNPDLKMTLASHDIDHTDLLKLGDVLFHEHLDENGVKQSPFVASGGSSGANPWSLVWVTCVNLECALASNKAGVSCLMRLP